MPGMRTQPATSIALGVLVALATVITTTLAAGGPATASPSAGPGQSSIQAFARTNETVLNGTGAPWTLLGMEGIVSSGSTLPMGAGQGSCQGLAGVTM